ncbi:hypothetical protein XENOCAPTIV_012947 [Xenoophorus captivus]|uniref:Uncharacterized protein n=1 Tax=Xenoophorus captivus TaxID=1517983 RepID=A0ABV0S8M7_9TELE
MDGSSKPASDRILLEPYKYLLQLPGKQVRTKLSQAFNHWLNVPEDKLQVRNGPFLLPAGLSRKWKDAVCWSSTAFDSVYMTCSELSGCFLEVGFDS